MSDPASRRRRPSAPPPPKRSSGSGGGGGPLPTVALAIGVIVAGLGIGALVSAFQNRGTVPELGATSIPAVTPVPQVTGPRVLQPLAPSPSPSASPRPSPSPSPSPAPTHMTSPVPSPARSAAAVAPPAASASPRAAPDARPSATPAPSPTAHPSATPAPSATARASAPAVRLPPPPIPSYASTPAATRPASAPPARPVASTADTALAVVKRYIDSLIAGDETVAYAALGGSSTDRSLDLKEEAFLDKDARITSLRASRSDATSATVDAEINAARGSYVATFRVVNGIITQHDYIKI